MSKKPTVQILSPIDTIKATELSSKFPKNITRRTSEDLWVSITDPMSLTKRKTYVIEIYDNPFTNLTMTQKKQITNDLNATLKQVSIDFKKKEDTLITALKKNEIKLNNATTPNTILSISRLIKKIQTELDSIIVKENEAIDLVKSKYPKNRLIYTGYVRVSKLITQNTDKNAYRLAKESIQQKYDNKLKSIIFGIDKIISNLEDETRIAKEKQRRDNKIKQFEEQRHEELINNDKKFFNFEKIHVVAEPLKSNFRNTSKQAFTFENKFEPCVTSCTLELVRGYNRDHKKMVQVHMFQIHAINNENNTNHNLEAIMYEPCKHNMGNLCKFF